MQIRSGIEAYIANHVGRPFGETKLRVVDPETGAELVPAPFWLFHLEHHEITPDACKAAT